MECGDGNDLKMRSSKRKKYSDGTGRGSSYKGGGRFVGRVKAEGIRLNDGYRDVHRACDAWLRKRDLIQPLRMDYGSKAKG